MQGQKRRQRQQRRGGRKKARTAMVSRVPRMMTPRNAVMNCKRTKWIEYWQPSPAITAGFWKQYNQAFSDVFNATDFTNLFDEYKINAIKLKFVPRYDGNDAGSASPQNSAMVSVCYDTRSSLTPSGSYSSATYNAFSEQGLVKTYATLRPFTVYWKPSLRQPNFIAGSKFLGPQWLPTAATTETHYGPHIFMHDMNFTASFRNSYDIFITHYISLRGVK